MDTLQLCISKLKNIFNLPTLLPSGKDASCTIIMEDPKPLVITFLFGENIEVKATLIHNCPTNILVLQAIMNQVVADLFAHDQQFGRLVFNEKEKKLENILKFNNLDDFQEQIELILPLFIHKCYQWVDKLGTLIAPNLQLTPFKEREIVSFISPF